ncbi:MAG: response regulator transcription factor [Chloroflexi bacterium]|nr:MAG: response regulator transcription factor [Chloroflexota bacterium]
MRALVELRDPLAVALAAAAALAAVWLGHDLLAIAATVVVVLLARVGAGLALRRQAAPAAVAQLVPADAHWYAPLTRREDRLVLSERTIDNHVQNIMNKLNLHHRAQIASWVTERTRVTPTPKP